MRRINLRVAGVSPARYAGIPSIVLGAGSARCGWQPLSDCHYRDENGSSLAKHILHEGGSIVVGLIGELLLRLEAFDFFAGVFCAGLFQVYIAYIRQRTEPGEDIGEFLFFVLMVVAG